MAIALDAVALSAASAAVSSLTFSHTVNSGSNSILIVSVGGSDSVTPGNCIPTGVTYGGVSLTKVGSATETGAGNGASVWYLLAPTVGTANVVVTFGASIATSQAGSISLFGVHQTTPVDVSGGAAALSVTLTTTAANDWIIDAAAVGTGNGGRISGFGAGQTAIYPASFNSTQGGSYSGPYSTGSNTVSFTASGFTQEAYFAAAFQPAAGGGFTAKFRKTLSPMGTKVGSRQLHDYSH
jgi:hypothetical protein